VAYFRVLLVVFGLSVTFLAARYMMTGQRHYLHWAARIVGLALALGVLFFTGLLVARLA